MAQEIDFEKNNFFHTSHQENTEIIFQTVSDSLQTEIKLLSSVSDIKKSWSENPWFLSIEIK